LSIGQVPLNLLLHNKVVPFVSECNCHPSKKFETADQNTDLFSLFNMHTILNSIFQPSFSHGPHNHNKLWCSLGKYRWIRLIT